MVEVSGKRDAVGTTMPEPYWDVIITADSCEVYHSGDEVLDPAAQQDDAKVHTTCPDATTMQFNFTQDDFWDDVWSTGGWKRRLQVLRDSLLFVPERADGCERFMGVRSLQPAGEPALLRRGDFVTPGPGQFVVDVLRVLAMTFVYAIPVAVSATLPVLAGGWIAGGVSQGARVPGSSLKNLETDVDNAKIDLRILWLTTVPRYWNAVGAVGLWWIHVFVPYKGRYQRNLFCKTEGVNLVVNVIWFSCRPFVYQAMGDSYGCLVLQWAVTLFDMGWYVVNTTIIYYCSYAYVGSKCSGLLFCGASGNAVVLFLVLQEVFGSVLLLPQVLKVCAVGVGVPLVFHLLIHAPMRMIARTLPNIDPVIRCVTLCGVVPYEKLISRILIMTIKDLYLVTIACIVSSSLGGIVRTGLGKDDIRLYKVLKKLGARGDPDAVLSHPENYYLQSTTSLLEVVCDIAAVCCAASVQLFYGVEAEPGLQPSVMVVLRNGALQVGLKVATFVVTIAHANYGKKEDLAGIVRRIPVKWLICPIVASMWTAASLTCVWMPFLICVPKTGDGNWEWCIS